MVNKRLAPPAAVNEEAAGGDGLAIARYLGAELREKRLAHGLTIAEVSKLAGISRGMLSKIENGQCATSLDTLHRLARALGLSLSALFRDVDMIEGNAQLVRAGEGMEVVRRGTRSGHTYRLLAYDQGPEKLFEPFLISLDDASEVFPTFQHPGTELIYMLQGRMTYRHGNETYEIGPGDTLTFRGDVPHGPEVLSDTPTLFLAIIIYGRGRE
ncbi:MAG: helix-turn-helix domain-containing protein [Burkholderiaceae bacterium]